MSKKIAVVFPGQGSQTVGMLSELYEVSDTVKNTFAQAEEALQEDLWGLISDGPQDQLNLTRNAQPALLATSVAVWRVLREDVGFEPVVMAGHSLGEWSALVCAGAIDFADALRLVRARGEFMQQAVPVGQGTMAAIIGLADDVIESVCEKAGQGEVIAAVNYNSPGQVVIAGQVDAVDRAMALCKEAGAKRALPLSVSAPFHTALMKPAADKLAQLLDGVEVKMPQVPIVHNVHAGVVDSVDALREIIIEQIYAPVRWVDCVNAMAKFEPQAAVECGPGKVLSGLIKRINRSLSTYPSESSEQIAALKSAFSEV